MRLLIVDDDPAIRTLLAKFLAKVAECKQVGDGPAAVDAFLAAHKANNPFDIVSLDIDMPGMDGHAVLAKIREYENEIGIEENAAVRILMSSAHGDADNVYGAFAGGCGAYLHKPITQVKLLEQLRKLGIAVKKAPKAES